MNERLQIRAKPAEAESSTGAPRARRTHMLREALQVVRSIVPSRDPSRNGKEKLALHLGVGLPIAHAGVFLALVNAHRLERAVITGHPSIAALSAVVFGALLVGPFLATWIATFGLSVVFLLLANRSRSRVRQALVCPFCRDEVEQEGTLSCARKGCGALYHRECWEECAQQYGGCAIYGCSSRKSHEVTAAGYVLQVSRLLLAAFLFPPRVARAIRDHGGEGFAAVFRRSLARAYRFHGRVAAESPNQLAIILLGVAIPAVWLMYCAHWGEHRAPDRLFWTPNTELTLLGNATLFVAPAVLLVVPFLLALVASIAFYGARAIAGFFKGELAALQRGDEGGGSVLGRLRLGLGSKK